MAAPYLVFELLRGKMLQERMDDGPLPVQEAVHIATELARGARPRPLRRRGAPGSQALERLRHDREGR